MEKEDRERLQFLLQAGNIRLFFIWWWSSVWGDQEQWKYSVCLLPGHLHVSWRACAQLMEEVLIPPAAGISANSVGPAGLLHGANHRLVNNWNIFHLVFDMPEHGKKLSHLEELYSNGLIIPNSNKLKSWIGSAMQVCLSDTGQQSTTDKFEHKSSLLCHVLCFTKLCGKLITLYVETSFFWRTECLWKWDCFMF